MKRASPPRSRVRAFAGWLSSFTICCGCCCNLPAQIFQAQMQQIPVQPIEIPDAPPPPPQKKIEDFFKKNDKGNPPAPQPGKVTRANFERIRDGMTLQEVEAILGPGGQIAAVGNLRTLNWANFFPGPAQRAISITITFMDNRVSQKVIAD
jgi:hypothetical protein